MLLSRVPPGKSSIVPPPGRNPADAHASSTFRFVLLLAIEMSALPWRVHFFTIN